MSDDLKISVADTPPRTFRCGYGERAVAAYPWPADCGIQGGGDGVVLTCGTMAEALSDPGKAVEAVAAAVGITNPPGSYRTAFFEAFPRAPDTFIRGEGKTVAEAEADAWRQFQRFTACKAHEWERRDYRTGAGICRKCGQFGVQVFETTLDPCVVCARDDNRASYGVDRLNRWHCEPCSRNIPEENKSEIHKMIDRMRAEKD